MLEKPFIGAIVHFRYGGICFAAIVTYVFPNYSDIVNLYVFDNGVGQAPMSTYLSVYHGELEYQWHWPERD